MIDKTVSRINIFGASDTPSMMMGFDTDGFKKFWLVKTGVIKSDFVENKYTRAGTMLEEDILNTIAEMLNVEIVKNLSYQSEEYPKLIVNLDGVANKKIIHEVKTSKYEHVFWGKVSTERNYIKQVQVQMYASGIREAVIDYYGLKPSEYEIEFLINPVIDRNRIKTVEVPYDFEWINECYLPRLKYLSDCIDKDVFPTQEGFERSKK